MTDCPLGRASRSGYQAGCRCEDCCDEQRTYMALYRAGGRRPQPKAPKPKPAVDTSWMAHKACKPEHGDLFFPGRGESTAPAKAICARCPVAGECLDFALRNGEHVGIWGGTSERDRRALRRRIRGAA